MVFLREWTSARVALGRSGVAVPTREHLEFKLAHAAARDAIQSSWNPSFYREQLKLCKEDSLVVQSQVNSRADYLIRPDLGRILSHKSYQYLDQFSIGKSYDLVFVLSDGLSPYAIDRHFLPFWNSFKAYLDPLGYSRAPLILAPLTRVAISDEIGFVLRARMAVIFIGERPGLSANDSLGIYLTYHPKPGNQDSNRNCISNIRTPNGLSYEVAAQKLIHLIQESFGLKLSGVLLKEGRSLNPVPPLPRPF